MRKLTRRQLNSIKHLFREKDERARKEAEKFRLRAPSGDGRKKESLVSLLAGKVNQILIVGSFTLPPLKTGLIDRFLVLACREDIEPLIVLNKSDLLESQAEGEKIAALYRSLGYYAVLTSTVSGHGIDFLRESLKGRISLIAGHSGVGKSSLLKHLAPDLPEEPETREVSLATRKGVHTTTSVRFYRRPDGTGFYDLPGLKHLSLHAMEARDIGASFPEILQLSRRCRYDDCLHRNEPQCAVRQGMEEGLIEKERYNSYLRIVESL